MVIGEDGVGTVQWYVENTDREDAALITGWIEFQPTDEAIVEWQNGLYAKILDASKARQTEIELARREQTRQQLGPEIRGDNPFLNREIERTELWRHVVTMLSCQHLHDFKAMKRRVEPCGYPQLDFEEATERSRSLIYQR